MKLVDPEEYKNASEDDPTYASIRLKTPRRILHFSDGILEEYSDDEVDSTPREAKSVVDPSTLTWGPWTWYKLWSVGNSTISYLDAAGEFMAAFFGITTPRYYFELEEYKKQLAQHDKDEIAKKGWSEPSASANIELTDICITQPNNIPTVV